MTIQDAKKLKETYNMQFEHGQQLSSCKGLFLRCDTRITDLDKLVGMDLSPCSLEALYHEDEIEYVLHCPMYWFNAQGWNDTESRRKVFLIKFVRKDNEEKEYEKKLTGVSEEDVKTVLDRILARRYKNPKAMENFTVTEVTPLCREETDMRFIKQTFYTERGMEKKFIFEDFFLYLDGNENPAEAIWYEYGETAIYEGQKFAQQGHTSKIFGYHATTGKMLWDAPICIDENGSLSSDGESCRSAIKDYVLHMTNPDGMY